MRLVKNPAVIFGLIMTALTAGCLVVMEITGENQSFDSKSFIHLLYQIGTPLLVWYLGIRARRTRQKGKLTYQEGFQEGLKISLTYAVTSPWVFLIYYLFINPDIVSYVRGVYHLTYASNTTVIAVDLLFQVILAFIFGVLYSSLLPIFLRNKK